MIISLFEKLPHARIRRVGTNYYRSYRENSVSASSNVPATDPARESDDRERHLLISRLSRLAYRPVSSPDPAPFPAAAASDREPLFSLSVPPGCAEPLVLPRPSCSAVLFPLVCSWLGFVSRVYELYPHTREDRVAKACYRASHCERAPGAGVY